MARVGSKKWWIDEARSFMTTVLTFMAVDGAFLLTKVYEGAWDEMLMWQIVIVFCRSIVKTVLTLVFPMIFPARLSVSKEK